jgi:ABC-type branched-subunit amino acid transport system substrate-binding protein
VVRSREVLVGPKLRQIAFMTLLCGCTSALDFSAECESDSACASLGPDLVCISGQCVPDDSMQDGGGGPRDMPINPMPDAQVPTIDGLMNQGCLMLGRSDGDARIIGAFLPANPATAEAGLRHAVGDINTAGGLDGRALGVLACPTPIGPEAAVMRARQMAEVVSEPALIGAEHPQINAALYTEVARIYGLVLLTPTTAEPSRADVDDDGLLWHIRGSARQDAAAIAHLALEDDPTSVAILHRDTAWGRMLASQAEAVLCAAGRCPPEAVQSLGFAPFSDELFALAERAGQADAVLSIGRPADALPLFSALADAEVQRVFAVGGPRSATQLGQLFNLDEAGESRLPDWRADLRSTLLCSSATVGPNRRGPAWDGWIGDFETVWPAIDAEGAAPYVDAVFALAYALVSAERTSGEVTGARIADGLTRLSSGPRIRVGRLDWTAGIAALADGDIDLEGVSGALVFDPLTGAALGGVDGRYTPPAPPPACGEE